MPTLRETDDTNLVQLIKRGSKDAFAQLYQRYSERIFRFACSYLKSEYDAEELVQDVFIKVWNKRDQLNSSQNIKAFIFKIAVNTIYDFIRRKNIEQAFYDFSAGNVNTDEGTWNEVVYNDMLALVNRLIAQMPEQRRKIFRMSREEGLSNDEISIQLGLSKRTVENQLYRATNYLKEHLRINSGLALLFFYLFY